MHPSKLCERALCIFLCLSVIGRELALYIFQQMISPTIAYKARFSCQDMKSGMATE